MPRVKLKEQPSYDFHYELQVQVGHLNYAGHLGHDSVVSIAHEARVHLFHALGVAETDLGDGRTGTIIPDLSVCYLSEGYLFDNLSVDSHVGDMGRSSFRIFQRLTKGPTILALFEAGMIAFDYSTRSIVPIPAAFINALHRHIKKNRPSC